MNNNILSSIAFGCLIFIILLIVQQPVGAQNNNTLTTTSTAGTNSTGNASGQNLRSAISYCYILSTQFAELPTAQGDLAKCDPELVWVKGLCEKDISVHSAICANGLVDKYLQNRHLTEFPRPTNEPVFKNGTNTTITGSDYLSHPPLPSPLPSPSSGFDKENNDDGDD
jgi:hypothetical protein